MNRRSVQSIALVVCAGALIYSLVVLQRDGTLTQVWEALTSGSFGSFPL